MYKNILNNKPVEGNCKHILFSLAICVFFYIFKYSCFVLTFSKVVITLLNIPMVDDLLCKELFNIFIMTKTSLRIVITTKKLHFCIEFKMTETEFIKKMY